MLPPLPSAAGVAAGVSPASSDDPAYAPDDDSAAAAAFLKSDNHALGDLELQPYTPLRIVAAQSMGLRHPNIGEEAMEQFRETGVYPGALADTLIVLYLCSLTDDPLDDIRAGLGLIAAQKVRRCARKPDEAYQRAIDWGHERGITNMRGETFWKAYGKFIDIVSEIGASTTVPVNTNGEGATADAAPNP